MFRSPLWQDDESWWHVTVWIFYSVWIETTLYCTVESGRKFDLNMTKPISHRKTWTCIVTSTYSTMKLSFLSSEISAIYLVSIMSSLTVEVMVQIRSYSQSELKVNGVVVQDCSPPYVKDYSQNNKVKMLTFFRRQNCRLWVFRAWCLEPRTVWALMPLWIMPSWRTVMSLDTHFFLLNNPTGISLQQWASQIVTTFHPSSISNIPETQGLTPWTTSGHLLNLYSYTSEANREKNACVFFITVICPGSCSFYWFWCDGTRCLQVLTLTW